MLSRTLQVISVLAFGGAHLASAQVDLASNVLQLAINQPSLRSAQQPTFPDGSFNERKFMPTNLVLLLASAPLRLSAGTDSVQPLSPVPDAPSGLTGDASPAFQPVPNPAQTTLFAGVVVQGGSPCDQSNFRAECVEPSLLADLRCCEQSRGWQIGGGGLFNYGCRNWASRFVIHCGPSFRPQRETFEREHCVGLLFQFELGKRKPTRE